MPCKRLVPTEEQLEAAPVGSTMRVRSWGNENSWIITKEDSGAWRFDCDWSSYDNFRLASWFLDRYYEGDRQHMLPTQIRVPS